MLLYRVPFGFRVEGLRSECRVEEGFRVSDSIDCGFRVGSYLDARFWVLVYLNSPQCPRRFGLWGLGFALLKTNSHELLRCSTPT